MKNCFLNDDSAAQTEAPLLSTPALKPTLLRRSFWRRLCSVRALLIAAMVLPLLVTSHTVQAEDGVHVVQSGETLSRIAQQYNVALNELASNNGIVNPNVVYVGQRLVIPGSSAATRYAVPIASATLPGDQGYFTVGRGDSLSLIARDHAMTLPDLLRLNGLSDPNFIWVGQQLRVSARVSPAQWDPEKAAKPKLADTIYVVKADESLADIASQFEVTEQELLVANGLPNANFVWVGQRLRIYEPAPAPAPAPAPQANPIVAAPADGYRYIEVNLTDQTLTAWQGDAAVLYTSVSTGTWATPTVTGRFSVGTKYTAQRMTGPGYDLPGVPWVMYFYGGYAIHGTYWHNNFGTPMSHGCVNMRTDEAAFLYNWAPPGTEVYVHY